MEGETKTPRTDDQESTFFVFLWFFFLKIQNIRKSKTPIYEKGSHKNFLDQVLTIFQTSPGESLIKFEISKEFDIMFIMLSRNGI